MSKTALNKQTIEFSISLSGIELSQEDQENLLNRYIYHLIDELQIPAVFNLYFTNSDAKTDTTLKFFDISIQDKKCRIPYKLQSENRRNVGKLASNIMESIHLNRELLITPNIIQLLKEAYLSESKQSLGELSDSQFERFIKTMIKRGFSLARLEEYKPETIADQTYLHHFDTITEAVDSTNIRVSYNTAYKKMSNQTKTESLPEISSLMQDGLFYKLGITFPEIKWEIDEHLSENEFQIQLNDVSYPIQIGLKPDEVLVNDTADRLTVLNVKGKPAINPANGAECAIIQKKDTEVCEQAGLTTWDALGFMILAISSKLRKQAGSFLTKDLVEYNLNSLAQAFPALVDTVNSKYDPFMITWILRDLLDEEISIRDLRTILDYLLLADGTTNVDTNKYIVFIPEGIHLIHSYPDKKELEDLISSDYADYIRSAAQKRYLPDKYTRGGNTLVVYLLDPQIEDKIRESVMGSLSNDERDEILKAVYREMETLPPTTSSPVILTAYDIRRPFRKMIEVEFPYLAVLCYQELSPDLNIQPIARISLPV